MCRACSDGGGRRCARTESTRTQERTASARYYQRGLARRKVALLADAGIPAVTDLDMPPSYHMDNDERPLDLAKGERDMVNPRRASPDKPEGALWAAPGRTDHADGSTKTAWTDWASRNWRSRLTAGGGLAEIKAQPGAVIVCVSKREDAQSLMDRYGTTDEAGQRAFDWEAMRRDGIDGVYVGDVMERPIGEDPGHAASNFYAWDTASVAWLSTEKVEVTGTRDIGTYEYEDPHDDADGQHGGFYPEVKIDPGSGDYDVPARPELDAAWGKVPKRFRPNGPAPAPEHDPLPGDEPEGGPSSGYQYTHPGATAPKEMDVLDLGIAVLGVATKVRSAKSKKKTKKAS